MCYYYYYYYYYERTGWKFGCHLHEPHRVLLLHSVWSRSFGCFGQILPQSFVICGHALAGNTHRWRTETTTHRHASRGRQFRSQGIGLNLPGSEFSLARTGTWPNVTIPPTSVLLRKCRQLSPISAQ